MAINVSLKTKPMKLEGVPELAKTLREILKTLEGRPEKDQFLQRLRDILMKPASMIRDEAKDMVPVKTGKLKASLFAAPLRRGAGAVAGSRGVFYAPFVEYGTSKTQANPFLRPAILATRPLAANMLAPDLKGLIDEVAREYAVHPSRKSSGDT